MYLLITFFPHKHLKPPFPAFSLVLFSLTCNIGRFVSMSFCARMHISRVYADLNSKSPFVDISKKICS